MTGSVENKKIKSSVSSRSFLNSGSGNGKQRKMRFSGSGLIDKGRNASMDEFGSEMKYAHDLIKSSDDADSVSNESI